MERRTYRLILAYDGTGYKGWQRLPNGKATIQSRVEQALSEIFGEEIEISGSGRTDAGVHARGQVVSFRGPAMPTEKVLGQLRHKLPSDIGALSLDYAADRFHARLCAIDKTYVYRVWNSPQPDVFGRHYRCHIPQRLDVERMRKAAALLTGEHDFIAFCANKHFKKSSVRKIKEIDIKVIGEELSFRFTADGFLYHMVRIMAGTLLEIGMGKREVESIPEIFTSRRRELAGETAPACGLCLEEVRYD